MLRSGDQIPGAPPGYTVPYDVPVLDNTKLTPGQQYQQTHPGPEPTPSTWDEFWGQMTSNPLKAPYEMATGQMGGHPMYRDLLVYGGAALIVLVAIMGMLR